MRFICFCAAILSFTVESAKAASLTQHQLASTDNEAAELSQSYRDDWQLNQSQAQKCPPISSKDLKSASKKYKSADGGLGTKKKELDKLMKKLGGKVQSHTNTLQKAKEVQGQIQAAMSEHGKASADCIKEKDEEASKKTKDKEEKCKAKEDDKKKKKDEEAGKKSKEVEEKSKAQDEEAKKKTELEAAKNKAEEEAKAEKQKAEE